MYNPTIGQFIQRDPIPSDPNLYAYCGDSPLMYTDPSGQTKKRNTGKPNIESIAPSLEECCYWLVIAVNSTGDFAGGTGHTWIALVDTHTHPATVTSRGITPARAPDPLYEKVPAQLVDDAQTKFTFARAYRISGSDYKKLTAEVAAKGANPGTYQVRTANCTTWAIEVLRSVISIRVVDPDDRAIGIDPTKPDLSPFYSPTSMDSTLRGDTTEGSVPFGE
jgi:hypothetical protein